jgi:Fe-S-cluster-containing dehydrogenase component
MTHYAMIMDTRRCIGCESCTVACRVGNQLPLDMIYNPVTTVGPTGTFPHVHMQHYPLICMHCSNPPCVSACPTGASQQAQNGIVWVEEAKCIGCKACIQVCPYHARHPNRLTGTVYKCDFCKDRIQLGLEPLCVKTCHQRARIFGDLDDPASEVSRLFNTTMTVQLLAELDTDPSVYYIMSAGGQG